MRLQWTGRQAILRIKRAKKKSDETKSTLGEMRRESLIENDSQIRVGDKFNLCCSFVFEYFYLSSVNESRRQVDDDCWWTRARTAEENEPIQKAQKNRDFGDFFYSKLMSGTEYKFFNPSRQCFSILERQLKKLQNQQEWKIGRMDIFIMRIGLFHFSCGCFKRLESLQNYYYGR